MEENAGIIQGISGGPVVDQPTDKMPGRETHLANQIPADVNILL